MQRIAVMGAGAVGSFFGGMLARAGLDVTLIARGEHLAALTRDGLFLDSKHFQERLRVRASGDPAAVRDAEMVLFAVKTTGTAEAARAIAPHLAPGAVVLSLQNGVDNVAQIINLTQQLAQNALIDVGPKLIGAKLRRDRVNRIEK